LKIFLAVGCWLVVLEVGLDGLVLLVELGEIRDDVLDYVGMWERIDLGFLLRVGGDSAQAGQGVYTIDVHRTASADTLSATPSESQGRIDFILDSDQSIQHHGSRLVQVQSVALHARLGGRLVGIPSVDVKGLDLCLRVVCRFFDRGTLGSRYSTLLRNIGYRCEAAER